MPSAPRLPVANISDTGGAVRPPWFRDRLSREIEFVRFIMRSHPETAMPIRDLPPPVPMSLNGFPSLDNVLGCPEAPKYILLADIWMNDDTGHNEDTTGLGYEYRWRHHWRIWATPYAGHVWVVICHTQSTFRWRDPTALIQPGTPAALAVLQHIQQGMSPLSPEPRGRSMQDTCFMLGSASLLSFWGNISQERSADVWPNASFAVLPIIDNSIQHRFFTVQSDTYTPPTEVMTVLRCRRLMWMPNLNAIVSASQMNSAPRSAPSDLHDAWYKAIADRIEGEDGDSEEEDWSE